MQLFRRIRWHDANGTHGIVQITNGGRRRVVEHYLDEVWKDIPGFEGIYQVSNLGRVRSLDFEKHYYPIDRNPYKKILKGRILKTRLNGDGCKCVTLYKDGEKKFRRVHLLVANAFLKNPMEHEYVEFKDGDKSNAKLSNLQWISSSNLMIKAYKKRNNLDS